MGAWDEVLIKIVQRSFTAAHRGDRMAEGEALRQFDLLVKFGGASDLVSIYEPVARKGRN